MLVLGLLCFLFYIRLDSLCLPDKSEADKINHSLEQIDSRWKKLSVEIVSIETMLHEAIHHWKRYKASKDLLVGYMEEAERMLEAPAEQQLVS